MKKTGKFLSSIVAVALALFTCAAVVACGEPNDSDNGNNANGKQEYSVSIDGALATWSFNFLNIGVFGDEHWGMINLENWGEKKLAIGPDGTCIGSGCKWSIKLVTGGEEYELYITAHLTGNGTVYKGEGDYYYLYKGEYSAVADGYKLEWPTYGEVGLTGDFELITEGYDFADYIPSAPWKIDSTMKDTDEFIVTNNNNTEGTKGLQDKLWPSVLLESVFGGATFKVSGNAITAVVDVNLPM